MMALIDLPSKKSRIVRVSIGAIFFITILPLSMLVVTPYKELARAFRNLSLIPRWKRDIMTTKEFAKQIWDGRK